MIGNVYSTMQTAVAVCVVVSAMVTTATSEDSKNFYVAAENNNSPTISVTSSQSSAVDDLDVTVVDVNSSDPGQNVEVVIILGCVSGVFLLVAAVYLAVALHKRHCRRAVDSDKLACTTNNTFDATNPNHDNNIAKPRGLSWSNPNFRQNSAITFHTSLNNQPSTASASTSGHTVQHAVYHTDFQDPQAYHGHQQGLDGTVAETNTQFASANSVSYHSEREMCKSPSPSPTLEFNKDRTECDTPTGDEIQRRASIPYFVGGFDSASVTAHALTHDLSHQQLDELFLRSLSPNANVHVDENGNENENENENDDDGYGEHGTRGSLHKISSPMNQSLFLLSPTSSCGSSSSKTESTLRVAFAHGFHPKFVEGCSNTVTTARDGDDGSDVESEGFGYCSLERVQVVGPNAQGDPIVTEVYYRDNDGGEGPVNPPRDESILRATKSY